MIIDGHVHVHEKANGFSDKTDASLENLLVELDNSDIQKAVLLPISNLVSNDFVGRICEQHPDKFIGFGSVDPRGGESVVKDLRRDIEEYGLKGLKVHPRIQRIDLNSQIMIEIAKVSVDINLPILIDCFPQADNVFPIEETFPERIGELAQKVPEAKIIMAHAGGYRLWDAFFIARANPNLYLDFSFSISYFKGSSIEQDLGFVLRELGARRCIFGSDHPEMTLEQALRDAEQMVERIGLSPEDREYFFGKTLLSILPA
jgi:predicted TIM-barrel fold metal-dependent hydrolase